MGIIHWSNALRWPLRNQILLPMLLMILLLAAGTSLVHARWALRESTRRIESGLEQVAGTLSRATVPLTRPVLLQMRGLSGAEFVVTTAAGMTTSTINAPDLERLLQLPEAAGSSSAIRDGRQPVTIGGRVYLHESLPVSGRTERLHILYPQENQRRAWWNAVLPSIVAGGAGFLLAGLAAAAVAQRVTRPLRELERQVDRIAAGDYPTLPAQKRNDELADLSRSVNRMATRLRQYEDEIRANERMVTLGRVGAGLAHQLRNAATGCRLAIGLHLREHPGEVSPQLAVARLQLDLMERQLRRFLETPAAGSELPREPVELVALVRKVASLVAPLADHLGVAVSLEGCENQVSVSGCPFDLEQLLVNLLWNAIEAAARPAAGSARSGTGTGGAVRVMVGRAERDSGSAVLLEVADSGPGPAPEVAGRMFEMFQTDKPGGTGLGLAIARQIAVDHHGDLAWERRDRWTVFRLRLPAGFRTDRTNSPTEAS